MRLRDEPDSQAKAVPIRGGQLHSGSTQVVAPTQRISQVRNGFLQGLLFTDL